MSATVRLNSLTMDGRPDSDGDTFRVYDVQGLDSAEVDSQLTTLAGNGVNVDFARMKQRELLIRGNAWGNFSVDANLWRVRQKIENSIAPLLDTLGTVYFDFPSPGNSIQLDVRSLGKLHFGTPTGTIQGFEIPLTAPDPLKYGQTIQEITVNGSATVTNSGNYPVLPTAFLQVAASGVWIQNAVGGRLTLDGSGIGVTTWPSGTYLDFRNRLMFVPGIGFSDIVTLPRTWWPLQPGANSLTSSGNFRLEFRAAYR